VPVNEGIRKQNSIGTPIGLFFLSNIKILLRIVTIIILLISVLLVTHFDVLIFFGERESICFTILWLHGHKFIYKIIIDTYILDIIRLLNPHHCHSYECLLLLISISLLIVCKHLQLLTILNEFPILQHIHFAIQLYDCNSL